VLAVSATELEALTTREGGGMDDERARVACLKERKVEGKASARGREGRKREERSSECEGERSARRR
jgi:hypothetical protein